jgi:hypothetical protein
MTERGTGLALLPKDYEAWRHCIEVQCRLPLSNAFIVRRIAALSDLHSAETRRFIECYGNIHHRQIIAYFQRALRELA